MKLGLLFLHEFPDSFFADFLSDGVIDEVVVHFNCIPSRVREPFIVGERASFHIVLLAGGYSVDTTSDCDGFNIGAVLVSRRKEAHVAHHTGFLKVLDEVGGSWIGVQRCCTVDYVVNLGVIFEDSVKGALLGEICNGSEVDEGRVPVRMR